MSIVARFPRFAVTFSLLLGSLACTKTPERGTYGAFDRILSPLPGQSKVNEEYRDKALRLNAKYYYVLGEYLARKRDLSGALKALERARTFDEGEPEIYFSLSGVYLQIGKVEEAEALLRRTLELNPNHFSALLDLAQLIKGNGSLAEVHELFTRAAKIDPDADEAALGLVVLEMASKEYRKARKSLTSFIARKPDSHLGYFYLGTLEQDLGNFAQAERNYKKSLELRPDFVRATAYLGQIYESQNRGDEALTLFEAASEYAQGASFLKRIGEIRSERKEPEAARRAFASYLEVDGDDAEVMLRLAFLELEAKDYQAAEKHFRRITELKPEFASAYYFVGVLLEEKKQYKEALEWLQKVQSGSSVSLDTVKAMARIYAEIKEVDSGWKLFEKVYRQDPKVSKVDPEKLLVEMVGFLAKNERTNEALKFADEGIKKFPDSETLHYHRALAREAKGEPVQAARDIEFLIEKKKTKNPAILNFVGYVFADEGVSLPKAEQYIRQAQKIRPEDPFIADSLGWVLFKRGDFRGAETWLRKAHKEAPEEVVILEHLADCLVKLGSLQEATDLYAKALQKGHKKASDQARLRIKHDNLSSQVRALCANGGPDTACRVVRDPRTPASETH